MFKLLSTLALGCALGLTLANTAQAAVPADPSSQPSAVAYRSVKVDDLTIFYREAGRPEAPTLLLLHGFPSSSRMFDPLLARLAQRYHLVAPDYPGFGHSDAPEPKTFAYTFDHLASVMEHFTETLGLTRYALYVQDYGGPVGMRMALAHPERLQALIVQNAVSHEAGLGPLWQKRREFWADRATNEASLRASFFSLATTRQRHVGKNPNVELFNPDLWTDEFNFLNQPGQADIQSDLFYDYRNNVASYPKWQAWLRAHQPPTLVVWGQFDPSFDVAEVAAYRQDLPNAEIHVLEAGHFALDEQPAQIAALVSGFLDKQFKPSAN
ncbi:alpha/beta hydrolase [Pseudomonas sp. SZMC_28357]|uniref:alpha/beta fold hydrolase n=1 Tax=Pseudomonas sp. SZMC_28357 TaxID=3074380 RepID=UPI00287110DD|nr:alpha/beta hydrolase [Pseudomonas sp. SZMC_28357]MDR9752608.1 alpha/beta hydrolase [Pseudomonas sp. SZMC_28357]